MTRIPLTRVRTPTHHDEPRARIFISYRNDDEPFGAALIDHVLSIRFGTDAVFRAAKSIRLGEDYVAALIGGVRRSAVLLVVIGPRWSPPADDRFQPAGCVDWVRLEIAEAFRHDVRVIPVLLGVDPPAEADLPGDVARLARCQYVRIRHRNNTHDIDYLAGELAELVPGLDPARGTRARGPIRQTRYEEGREAVIVTGHPTLPSRGHTCPSFPDGHARARPQGLR